MENQFFRIIKSKLLLRGCIFKFIKLLLLFSITQAQTNGACTGNYTLLNGTDLSSSSLVNPFSTGGQFGSTTLCIQGTCNVDIDFTFTKCNIVMDDDAKIIVKSGKKLIIDQCWIHSCDGVNMWDQIKLEGGGFNLVVQNGSVIEDGDTAIAVASSAIFNITNCQFNKNYISINIMDSPSSVSSSYISGCLFSCYSTYNLAATRSNCLLEPWGGFRSENGIRVNNIEEVQIGDAGGDPMTFDYINEGIYSVWGGIEVYNSMFSENYIGISSVFNTVNMGERDLIVGGINPKEKCIFQNCNGGVYASQNINSYIYNNEFDKVANPIRVENPWSGTIKVKVEINFNKLIEFDRGIFCKICRDTRIEIKNNELNNLDNLTFASNQGISVINPSALKLHDVTIKDNIIRNCYNGIEVARLGRVNNQSINEISGNLFHITYNTPNGSYFGIIANNSEALQVSENEILRTNTSSNVYGDGFSGRDISLSKYIGNLVNNVPATVLPISGLHFTGNSIGTGLYCNTNLYVQHGVYLGDGTWAATFSQQGTSSGGNQNEWYDPNGGAFVRMTGIVNGYVKWFYNQGASYYPDNNIALVILHSVANGTSPCTNGFSLMDRSLIFDPFIYKTMTYKDHKDENEYLNNLFVYKSLTDDTTLIYTDKDEDSLYISFVDSLSKTSIDTVVRINNLMRNDQYEAANELNNSFVPTNQIESYLKTVNDIMLNNYLNETELSMEDSLSLTEISCKDGRIYGEVVYIARAILNSSLNDSDDCSGRKFHPIEFLASTGNSNFNVYPNPSSGVINISANKAPQGDLSIMMTDIYGKQFRLNSNSQTDKVFSINTIEIPAGIYLFNILINEIKVYCEKVVLFK